MEHLVVVVFCLQLFGLSQAAEWSYSGEHGPVHWKDDYPTCGLMSQSPINIVENEAMWDVNLDKFTLSSEYDTETEAPDSWIMNNNGHSVKVTPASENFRLTGGNLPAEFKLAQFHFHWGSSSQQGSEHTMDGKRYPLEVHFVHYNIGFDNLTHAADKPNGLAVLGFFFTIGSTDNQALEKILNKIDEIKYPGNETKINPLQLTKLMADMDTYWRYSGSLTTPPCHESVIWTVFKNTLAISEEQMKKLRSVYGEEEGHYLADNYRPIQDKHGRQVTSNQKTSGAANVKINSLYLSVSLLLLKVILS